MTGLAVCLPIYGAELRAHTKQRRTHEEEHFPDSHHPHRQSAPS